MAPFDQAGGTTSRRSLSSGLAVLRIVVREGFSLDLAGGLVEDIRAAVAFLEANPPIVVSTDPGFAH